MSREREEKLRATLQRLEATTQKILTTRGYSREARSVQMLQEMIREQLTDANSRSAARKIR